jgi:serine-type D-Ala-D-Ala carboxypeptidase/endopeptidase (penicillin-binding protein 4)
MAAMTLPILRRLMPSLGLGLALLHGAAVHADEPLPAPVQQALQAAALPASSLAWAAVPLGRRGRMVGYQAERSMQPGSTMKLVTSVVALEVLGPNHRGFTELLSAAPREGEVLAGDLVLRGGGEVELGVPRLWALLMELREAGVREIRGDIVLDRSRYNPPRTDLGLPPFDDAPEFPYNVIPDALNIAGSLLPLKLQSTARGVAGSTVPALDGITIDTSAMSLVDGRCANWSAHWKPALVQRDGGQITIRLQGGLPRDCTARPELQLLDRNELAAALLRTLWRGLGGTWTGRLREGTAPANAALLARQQARPWGELLRPLNKTSDNAWTRVLFHEIGAAAPAPWAEASLANRPTAERADAVMRRWFAAQGIDATALVTDNGSGLSRQERVTPRLLVEMLRAAWAGPHRHDLLATLPTVGVDGTMRLRLRDSPAAGWARLKTGTLRNVVGLAGVMRDGEGDEWAVALLINADNAARGRPVLDALVDHWARTAPDATAPLRIGPQGEGP